jgi:ABC-type nitrate/sulfonate/bicarbonate transport system permease component
VGLSLPIFIWEFAAFYMRTKNPQAATLFPSLGHVFSHDLPDFATFGQDIGRGYAGKVSSYSGALWVLAGQSVSTLGRVLGGTICGIALGVTTGLFMGWSPVVRRFLAPPIEFLRMIPSLALLPLFMLWFGGREIGPFLFVMLAISITLVINTVVAIRNVPPIYAQMARTLGANRLQVYRTIIIPAIAPGLIGAIRVTLGASWAIVLAAEYLAVQSGLGRLMILSEMFFYTGRMVVIVILFIIYSAILNVAFLAVTRRVTRWVPLEKAGQAE